MSFLHRQESTIMKLLQHFKQLTIHPTNAKELKGLILQLAIQGKLTANWRMELAKSGVEVESAKELLKRVQKEKEQLIKKKKIRKNKSQPIVNSSEKYFDIPDSWEWSRIFEIGNLFNGNSVNKTVKETKYSGLKEGYPYLGTKDINYGFEELNYDNGVKIPFEEVKFKIAPKNTPLICSEGGSAGKKCGITVKDICFGNKLYALDLFDKIKPEFILSLYQTPTFFYEFQERMTGIIGGISISNFGAIPLPIPPLKEQKEIVRVIEVLIKEVEQLEQFTTQRVALKESYVTSALHNLVAANTTEAWSTLLPQFQDFFTEVSTVKKLRETILQLAVQGKLTQKWRTKRALSGVEVQHASTLLENIKVEKAKLIAKKKIRKEKPLPPITEDEIPYEVPESWVWCRLKNLGFITGGGTPSKNKSIFWGGNIPWISPKDMKSEFIDSSQDKITKDAIANSSAKLIPAGSILIVGRSGILKRTIPISITNVECTVNQDMKVVVPYNGDMNIFIKLALKGMEGRLLKEYVKYGMTVHSLKYSEFELLTMPLPPAAEQKAIVKKVNTLMTLFDQLEAQITLHKNHSQQLMQAVLQEVFQ